MVQNTDRQKERLADRQTCSGNFSICLSMSVGMSELFQIFGIGLYTINGQITVCQPHSAMSKHFNRLVTASRNCTVYNKLTSIIIIIIIIIVFFTTKLTKATKMKHRTQELLTVSV